jgi:hypothetical protein
MADEFDLPLEELFTDLDRMTALLVLLRSVRSFGGCELPSANGDGDFGQAARELRTVIRDSSGEQAVLSGTLVLFLAGRFEHFVRMTLQNVCDGIASKCQTFEDLPDKMRKSLIYHTAEVVMAPHKYGFDSVQATGFIIALAGNSTATAGLGQVNSACLTVTQNNMTPGTMADLFGRIGVKDIWNDVGKQARMKLLFGLGADVEATNRAKMRLEELMTLRNQIAHPSGTPTFPDPDQVQAYVEFVRTLASVLIDVSRVQVAAFSV